MRVDKVIWRAALFTLAAITALFALMLLVLCFLFPWTMMQVTYNLGMERSCIRNGKRAYNMSDEVSYIAFATDVAISEGEYERVVECGEMFLSDAEFDSYCAKHNEELPEGVGVTYDQYVYAQVSLAKYRLGDKEGAVLTAFDSLDESFPKNNAVVAVLVTALGEEDDETVAMIREKMANVQSAYSEADQTYFSEILDLARNA